jgi:hypothetical protein
MDDWLRIKVIERFGINPKSFPAKRALDHTSQSHG